MIATPDCAQFYLPLVSPRGHRLQPLPSIAVGVRVQRGQRLAVNHWGEMLYAPATGVLTALQQHPLALPDTPNVSTWVLSQREIGVTACAVVTKDLEAWLSLPSAVLRAQLSQLGISGLGGAAFPAASKWPAQVQLLVINALECEPGTTADAALLAAEPDAVAAGIALLRHGLSASRTVLAIKPTLPVPASLSAAITVQVLAGDYPNGAERLLLAQLTGQPLSPSTPPQLQGLVCHNVGTAYAVYQALCLGLPPVGRWLSLTGDSLARPQAFWAAFGTPIAALLAACGYDGQGQVRVGGVYSGYPIPACAHVAPLQAQVNALHAAPVRPMSVPMPCIRCGLCADICPVKLQPQDLYWRIQAGQTAQLSVAALQSCLVCGLCETVCPSQIPLNRCLRQAKRQQRQQLGQAQQATQAKLRYTAHLTRLAQITQREAEQRSLHLATQEAAGTSR